MPVFSKTDCSTPDFISMRSLSCLCFQKMTVLHLISCPWLPLLSVLLVLSQNPAMAIEFVFNGFNDGEIPLIEAAKLDGRTILLTGADSNRSVGRAYFPTPLTIKVQNSTSMSSFSTSFIFSILSRTPETIRSHGLAFFLSPPVEGPVPDLDSLINVEFGTNFYQEFGRNHVYVQPPSPLSIVNTPAGYWSSTTSFESLDIRSGQNIQAWIDFDGPNLTINVTIVPAGTARPVRPLLSYRNDKLQESLAAEVFAGFSGWRWKPYEWQRVLAWSLSTNGPAPPLNTLNLPVFSLKESSSSKSRAFIAGISSACILVFLTLVVGIIYKVFFKKGSSAVEELEEWESEYWPHRIPLEVLHQATNGFSKESLLGSGGFGKVYRGALPGSNLEVAVKCVSRTSKQGIREFLAEIWSMGRLQHRSLVQLRGWCRQDDQLMLVYDFMPNGSLDKRIFDSPRNLLNWEGRRRVVTDVAEGLLYLHEGWEQQVVHRDVKSSNVLLDAGMRGRLGDFGLARLYQHGQPTQATHVVGTMGYVAPELASTLAPTTASDVYSFGVLALEVACGRRPIDRTKPGNDQVLVDWVHGLYYEGQLLEAADSRIAGEYREAEMEVMLKVGLACCHPNPKKRPSMRQAVHILHCIRAPEPPPTPEVEDGCSEDNDQQEP
ncbi:L-type lectin-domain containing receptor kinase S.1 [Amborella trichopoda]|nr:L-type lectin-domain containing receptor kinase S.1 [Amborella trichopoda]|eukprot:XP_006852326.2 L-type lectin-domain containing receptor kinase S.1 [Amborella trichopoda]